MSLLPARAATWGTLIVSTSAALWAGFWIYALSNKGVAVWSLPTWIALAAAAVGVTLLAFARGQDGGESKLIQRGGKGSTNIQAGRDVTAHLPRQDDP